MNNKIIVKSGDTKYKNISWEKFQARLENPEEKSESYLAGYLKDGELMRTALTIKLQHMSPGGYQTLRESFPGQQYTTYETEEAPVLIVPLSREIAPWEYELVSRLVMRIVNLDWVAEEDHAHDNWMDFPVSADKYFTNNKPGLQVCEPGSLLDTLSFKRDLDGEVRSTVALRRLDHQANSLHGDKEIQSQEATLFNQRFNIQTVTACFLADIFQPAGGDENYNYTGGDLTSSETVHGPGGSHLFSRDPANSHTHRLISAWDLLRLHKVGNGADSHAELLGLLKDRETFEKLIHIRGVGWKLTMEQEEETRCKVLDLVGRFLSEIKGV